MKEYYVLGLMSGTSLDGLDLCYVKFEIPTWNFEIINGETFPYPEEWKIRLKNSIHLSGEELTKLDVDYGFYLGASANDFLSKYQIEKIDLIASHGHTVFHNPQSRYTLQIGKGTAIFAETGIKTICDFRSQDVALGGQGAPLVPIGDELLFGKYDACLNLGGFSNISFKRKDKRIAFDISPLNIVFNYLAEKEGRPFDLDGEMAKNGIINKFLLEKLNSLAYYKLNPPKSLGVEWCLKNIFQLIENSDLNNKDLMATFSAHFAQQISSVFLENQIKNVLVTGGGTKNKFLIKQLLHMNSTEIIIPNDKIIDFKEALIFALMGVLKNENEINVLSSVTGATKNHSSGIIIC